MTYQNVYDGLSLSVLPITYYQWQKGSAPAPPYLIYYYPNRDDFRADNENYARVEALNVELYTANKDFALETLVEAILDGMDFVYDKEEQYIESEGLYECLYTMEVVINAED